MLIKSNAVKQVNKYLKEQSKLDTLRFITCGSVDDGKRVELTFRVNGSSVQNTRTYAATGSANTGTDLTYSQQLSTGDYVEVYVYHNSSGSKDIVDGFFAVHKLIKG